MSDFGTAVASKPGTLRVCSDGFDHSVSIWTEAGQWEPLRGLVEAQVVLEAKQRAVVSLTLDAAVIEVLSEPQKAGLEVLVQSWPESEEG